MKYLAFAMLFISLNVFACWKVEGTLGVDGETWKIEQKFDHDKEYSFPMGTFILNLTIKKGKKTDHIVKYIVQEKKGSVLVLVTKGEEEVQENKPNEIFAKGEQGQPNSIISLKLKHI